MKSLQYLFLLILILILTSCSDSNEDTQKILDLLNKNAECYSTKNLDCIMSTYLNDTSIIAMGTEKNFIGKGYDDVRKIYKKDLSQNWQMIEYEYRNPVINIQNDIAWLTANVYSKIKIEVVDEFNEMKNIEIVLDSRLTAVCKKIDGQWKFVLTNFQHFKNPADEFRKID
jgi:hypothetical protein